MNNRGAQKTDAHRRTTILPVNTRQPLEQLYRTATLFFKMAEKVPEKTSKFGKYVIKPERWIMDLVMSNCDIIPRKCRSVLIEMVHKGFIEDEEKFGEAFKIMMMVVTGNMVGDEDSIKPEDYQAVLEGRELKKKRDEADFYLQEFEEHMRRWNLEAREKMRNPTPSKELFKIPEDEERESS